MVAEIAKGAGQSAGSFADGLRVGTIAALFISDTLMQDLPGDPAKPMGDSPDCFEVSDSSGQAAVESLIETAFDLDRGVGRLIENAPHEPFPFGFETSRRPNCEVYGWGISAREGLR